MSNMRSLQRQVKRAKQERANRCYEANSKYDKPLEDQIREAENRLQELQKEQAEVTMELVELRMESRREKLIKKGAPMVWAKMVYKCDDCGYEETMYLENTLERHNGENHKPVPFGIICRSCGGFHCYDRSGLIPLPFERPLEEYESYFKDDKKYDCGKPVHR